MTRLNDLRAASADQAGALYERLVLDALALAAPPMDRWRTAYARLSDALTTRRDETLATAASGTWGGDDERAVAALVFGQRTFLSLLPIFGGYVPRGMLLDWGSGSGAAALAAVVRGARAPILIDAAPEALGLARKIFALLGVEARVAPASAPPPAQTIVAAHSLNEWRAREGKADYAAVLRKWLTHVGPGGRIFVIEPGIKETSRVLQAVRDSLRGEARILAPCTHAESCPLIPRTHDWCHMTWPLPMGPAAEALVASAGHTARRTVFSWLVLENADPLPADGRRVLQVHPSGKGKLVAELCGGTGHTALVGLDRGEVGALFRGLAAGEVVELDEAHTGMRGDGTRLEDVRGMRKIRPI